MTAQLRPGDYVAGEYRVLKVFGGEGKSGMGVVYLVENRSFYQPFILKTYQGANLGDRKARFLKEAEIWVQLGRHSNIVRCLWVNEVGDDVYVAAEYIAPDEDGFSTLEDRLLVGSIPLDKQLRWAAEFCFGMQHAVKKGLVAHRDLKPSNLMLDQGTLKLTDFGLSKSKDPSNQVLSLETLLGGDTTIEGSVMGTPPFMAPEQFIDSGKVDHRADIYSFGIILYLMATRELPISPDRMPNERDDLMSLWAHAHHRGRIRAANFPLFLVVRRCLERDVAKRFQSFDEILAELSRTAVTNAVALPKNEIADTEFDDAYALAMSLTALGKRDEAIKKLAEITGQWPEHAQPFNEMGKILLIQGKTSDAIPWFKRALEIDETRSPAWNNLGGAHARLGELEPAELAYSCAIKNDSENTGAMIGLAQVLMKENPDLALKWCEQAYELRPKKLNVLRIGGEAALRANKAERATQFFSEALELDPNDQRIAFNLALTYRARRMVHEYINCLESYLNRWNNDREAFQLLSQGYVDIGQMEKATDVCLRWSKAAGAEVSGTINLAHLLAAQSKNLQGYVFLNKALEQFPRHAGLWLCMAHILKDIPQYREQARTAAENAMVCLKAPPTQPPRVTEADVEPILKMLK